MKRKILVVLIILFIVNIIVTFSDKYGFSCESISRTDLYKIFRFLQMQLTSSARLCCCSISFIGERKDSFVFQSLPNLPTLTQTSHTLTQTSPFSLKLFPVSKSVHNLPLYCTFSLVK